ncbi:MAG: hypothetical protein KDF59_11815 [Nitrosomonas sp.]|nr:hypothetical protein [Nitrosomonas sp.]
MLDHFPKAGGVYPHRTRDYFIAGFTFFCCAVSLVIDGSASIEIQNALGIIAWIFLFALLVGENKEIRMQVIIAVAFATIGEHFASLYMEGYTYRFENIPWYVPPGHGMVYLTAVKLARSGFFLMYSRKIAIFVFITGGLWALWGVSGVPEQGDQVGAFLFVIFVICVLKGRSPLVYLGAFFICTWLEIIGTAAGTWRWAEIEPVFDWSQGNPPSGVAAWYCLVDAVAIGFSPMCLRGLQKLGNWYKTKFAN